MDYLGEKNYSPHLNDASVEFLKEIIKPTNLVLETGTGNSTIWFAKNAKKVVSFENKRFWYEKVLKHLHKNNLSNFKIYFDEEYFLKELADLLSPEDLTQYDIVLHDGPNGLEKRAPIAYRIWEFVKCGGYLLVDDVHHNGRYREALEFLRNLGWEKKTLETKGQEKKALALRRV